MSTQHRVVPLTSDVFALLVTTDETSDALSISEVDMRNLADVIRRSVETRISI